MIQCLTCFLIEKKSGMNKARYFRGKSMLKRLISIVGINNTSQVIVNRV